jgi:ATP-dependent DNA ligase
MVFDLMYWHRRDLTGRALGDRRVRLEDVVAGSELAFPVRRLAADGLEAWKQVVERGDEGYVAKDEANVDDGGARGRRGAAKGAARLEEGPVAEADSRGGHS